MGNYLQPFLSLRDVSITFGSKKVLDLINLDIYKGQTILLAGVSGGGKSTLLKILLGIYKPDSGNIYNRFLTLNPEKKSSVIGFVAQENSFYEKLTVYENMKFFANVYGLSKVDMNTRIDFLLSFFNLDFAKKTLASSLSGGMKRRLEFAITLLPEPLVLILDEPFSGLDVRMHHEIWHFMEKIKKSGVTIVISSHFLLSAQMYVDRTLILYKGKFVADLDIKKQNVLDPSFNLEKYFLEVTGDDMANYFKEF